MVIQCEKCKTVYNIDDTSTQTRKVSARCVRCGHVFAIDDKAKDVVSPFLIFDATPTEESTPAVATPPSHQDQADVDIPAPPAADFDCTADSDAEPLAAAATPAQEPPAPTAQETPPATTVEEFSFSTATPEEPQSETAATSATSEAELVIPQPAAEFSFSTTGAATPPESLATPTGDTSPQDSDSDTFTFETLSNDNIASSEAPVLESADEFSFDSIASQDRPTESSAVDPTAMTPPPLSDETAALTPTPPANQSSPPNKAATKTTTDIPTTNAKPVAEKRAPSRLLLVLLLIIILLAGGYGYLYTTLGTTDIGVMIDTISRRINPPPAQPQGRIHIISSRSFYVDNATLGPLLIIEGEARNDYADPRAEIQVSASLFNAKGKCLQRRNAYCGNIITTDKLKTITDAEIKQAMGNSFGDSLSNTNVAPGKKVPFMLIFANIPPDLSEFSVEAARSKPASH